MPMPQLNVRSISASSRLPAVLSQPNTAGGLTRRRDRCCGVAPSGRTRGRFSESPPPVMCAIALTAPPGPLPPVDLIAASTASHRCGSARAGPRQPSVAGVERRRRVPARASPLDELAHQRVAVGMHARGRQADQHVAHRDVAARQNLAALDRADGEAGQIVVPGRYMPGISAVSPPISAQPACRQPSAMPAMTRARDRRRRACRWRNSRGRTAARPPARRGR